ncbi:MAG: hypothetical protein U5L00_08495 [Desulfovermiculus sp.]|nr:hypothetical protein [Desulfovermiculus sp.]
MLAPTFDVVTTTVYVPNDAMALTLDGSKKWPARERLLKFAVDHCGLRHKHAIRILEEVKHGVRQAQKKLEQGIRDMNGFST